MVLHHPSLQSTRTRRPGGRTRRQWLSRVRKPTVRTLQQLHSLKGRPTRLGRATLQLATAGNCSGQRKRSLRQTCSREDPENAICVQRLNDSLNSVIRTRYRIDYHANVAGNDFTVFRPMIDTHCSLTQCQ